MQSKISSIWSWSIVVIAIIAFSAVIIIFPNLDLPGRDSYAKPALATNEQTLQELFDGKLLILPQSLSFGETARLGFPIRLKIPLIGVDAAVERVGITPSGAMDVPKNQDNVAWFEPGLRPGEIGSAVMAGHYGRKKGKGSGFDDLHLLRTGDKVEVVDEGGELYTFVVREIRRYDPKADASDVFGSNDGKAHLNLITCEGVWDKATGGYTKRLVIFTDKE